MTVINSFSGDFSFLSNFHPSVIYVNGKRYPTVEHAYQAAKSTDESHIEMIRTARTAGEAKKLGKIVPLRPDWESLKLQVMEDLLRRKFENPFLRPLLMATKGVELIEGNYWHDTFWGVYKGTGENWLGKLLMKIRDEYSEEERESPHASA